MTATRKSNCNAQTGPAKLYLAIDLGWSGWQLAFTVGLGQKPRLRSIPAGALFRLEAEIAKAKLRFGLPKDAPVVSLYEAGRDGFWLHRFLQQRGMENYVVDSSSIDVKRRARRAKSDRLDADKLLRMLLRYDQGEEKVFSVVQAPSAEDEDARQLHRELQALKAECTQHANRIRGLLAGQGLEIKIDRHLPHNLKQLRTWDDRPLPRDLHRRILREFERMQVANRQIREVSRERDERIRHAKGQRFEQVRRLLLIKGIGLNSAWLFVMELFGWRKFQNGRQVGSMIGLCPTPYASGGMNHEQGISKAGNRRVRWMAVEIAWCWLRYQPESRLSRWYQARFGSGSSRQRRIGIVALARKLMVALWKYLEQGEVPDGAEMLDEWRSKVFLNVGSLSVA